MLLKSRTANTLTEQDVTDEVIYHDRRAILKKLGFIGAGIGVGSLLSAPARGDIFDLFSNDKTKDQPTFAQQPLKFNKQSKPANVVLTPEAKTLQYNNFYEFGTQKTDPYENSQGFKVNPWQLSVSGETNHTLNLDYDDLFAMFDLEERIYRLRCVETWSMVIPWVGFPLAALLKKADPKSSAKFVEFKTLHAPEQMPGQRSAMGGGIDYPYREGLRIDEAMHPLTFLAVGLYGKTLPPQNGAPIRLVVPWKYGFKSIKSIVDIKLTSHQPATSWHQLASQEYGFYANVNPQVAHPRWSQASERLITTGGLLSRNRVDTQMFNGYGEQVASLYKDMDLRKYY